MGNRIGQKIGETGKSRTKPHKVPFFFKKGLRSSSVYRHRGRLLTAKRKWVC
jgi:hypothetical protein